MRRCFRFAIALATLFLTASAAAQTLQWSIAPNGAYSLPVRAAFDPTRNRHHVAALDGSGNLFIAGYSFNQLPETSAQFLGKFDANTGAELWRFTAPAPSMLQAVAINAAGDAFVTGYYVTNTLEHQYVARINGATGAVMWEVRGVVPDAANSTETWGVDIVLDHSGNPVVLGTYARRSYVTKYDPNSGAVQWSTAPAEDVSTSQTPFGIEADPDGNIVGVTYDGDATLGETPGSLLYKLNGATGARVWATPWTWHTASTPEIQALTLDGAGKPILVGKGIAKFSNVDGSLIWQRTLRDDNATSFVYDATTDSTGDVFVTGAEDPQLQTVVTAKYRSADGVTRFHIRAQPSATQPNQGGKSITLDANQDVLVAARAFYDGTSTDYEIETLNYSNDGTLRYMDALYAGSNVGGGPADAKLVLHFMQHAYTLGTVTRTSDGALVTVALRYAEQLAPKSTTAFTASPNPAALGAPVTMSVTVSGNVGTPTGTVDFKDGSTPIAGCTGIALSNGTASCATSSLSPGVHTLWGIYSGDSVYTGSAGSQSETIQNNQATVSIVSSSNPSQFEQPVTFTASVSGSVGTPTGSVTFTDGANTTGIYGCKNVPLSGGSASCTVNGLMPGTHSIGAAYSGDSQYDPATSSTLTQTVQGSIATSALAWQAINNDSPHPFLDTVGVNFGGVTSRSGVDAAGNLYIAASTGTSTTSCLVVIKYQVANGAEAWNHQSCGPWGSAYSSGLVVDANGNPIVTGSVGNALYVAKLSASTGAPIWETTNVQYHAGVGIGIDAAGDVRVVAWDGGLAVFGIAGSDGSVQWERPLDTALGGKAQSFAVGADGSSVLYDRHTIDSNDNVEDAITRLDPFGSEVWRVIEPGGVRALLLDAQDNVIGSSLGGLEKRDATTGAIVWRQSFGGAVRIDAQGNLLVAGNVNTGNGAQYDVFFAKLDSAGNVLWMRVLVDSTSADLLNDMALDTDGNVLAVGTSGSNGMRVQKTYKVSAADGTIIWIATLSNPNAGATAYNVFATPQGALTMGEWIGGPSVNQQIYAALYSDAATAVVPHKVHTDYNGDAKGDLTLTNTATGQQGLWLMNGTSISSAATLSAGAGYVIKLVGDFDGDGESDVLYRGADGSYKIQLMNGGAVKSEATILGGGSGWEVVAKGDFNGDGKTDLLWKSPSGSYGMWLMSGTTAMGAGLFDSPGAGWDVQLIADFGGDGKADILWRNGDGRIQEWAMDGASTTGQVTMTSYQNQWMPLFAGDFDGDGKADIVWSYPDGSIAVWLVDGTTVRSATVLSAGNSGWTVKMVGDLDGDGKADIVLQHTSGETGAWLMDGASIKSAGSFGPAGFSPITIDDFDGDGHDDIIWRDASGAYQVTLMNGLTVTSSGSLLNGGTGWEVKPNDH